MYSMNKTIFFLILLLTVLSDVFARQEDFSRFESQTVAKIVILGNDHTRDEVILREMKTKVGGVFHEDAIEEDRKRIQNLMLFTRVEIYPARAGDQQVGLIVIVSERWHFFPYPLFFRNERSWDKWSYGAGLLHNNIRGMNNKLLTELWLGYNPGGLFSYINPWFGGEKHFYYQLQVYSLNIKSRSLQIPQRFNEQHHGFSFTFGRRYGYHTYATAMVGYDYVRFPAMYAYLQPSGVAVQHTPMFGFGFRYDTRDLYEYPRSGWFIELYVKETTFPKQTDYQQFGGDFRHYHKIYKEISIAARGAVDFSRGKLPTFSRLYLGYKERIRGQFFTQVEGENRAIGGVELRFPLLPVRYINIDSPGAMLGHYSQNLPFGISAGLFYDAGAVWRQKAKIGDVDFLTGFGAGLHFHVPYADVVRIEYALDADFDSQLIIDIEAAF